MGGRIWDSKSSSCCYGCLCSFQLLPLLFTWLSDYILNWRSLVPSHLITHLWESPPVPLRYMFAEWQWWAFYLIFIPGWFGLLTLLLVFQSKVYRRTVSRSLVNKLRVIVYSSGSLCGAPGYELTDWLWSLRDLSRSERDLLLVKHSEIIVCVKWMTTF